MRKDSQTPATPRDERPSDEKGVLRVTTGSLKIPEGIEAERSAGAGRISAVVVVVTALALAFIAFIAWLIHGGQ